MNFLRNKIFLKRHSPKVRATKPDLRLFCVLSLGLLASCSHWSASKSPPLAELEFFSAGDAPTIVVVRFFNNGRAHFEPVARRRKVHRGRLESADIQRIRDLIESTAFLKDLEKEVAAGNNVGNHQKFVGIKARELHVQRETWTLGPRTLELVHLGHRLACQERPELCAIYLEPDFEIAAEPEPPGGAKKAGRR